MSVPCSCGDSRDTWQPRPSRMLTPDQEVQRGVHSRAYSHKHSLPQDRNPTMRQPPPTRSAPVPSTPGQSCAAPPCPSQGRTACPTHPAQPSGDTGDPPVQAAPTQQGRAALPRSLNALSGGPGARTEAALSAVPVRGIARGTAGPAAPRPIPAAAARAPTRRSLRDHSPARGPRAAFPGRRSRSRRPEQQRSVPRRHAPLPGSRHTTHRSRLAPGRAAPRPLAHRAAARAQPPPPPPPTATAYSSRQLPRSATAADSGQNSAGRAEQRRELHLLAAPALRGRSHCAASRG